MPSRTQVAIIGGGIAGASIAYHLSELGVRDVTLFEQGDLVSGTTSHAPGLVGQLRSSATLMRLLMQSVALYRAMSFEGVPGYIGEGSLRLASSAARWSQLKKQAEQARTIGLEAQLIGPGEIRALAPLLDLTGVEGALHIPSDGSATAPILARALMRDAQARGVAVYTHCRVHNIELENGRVQAIVTADHRIECETLVVAAGIWSPVIARMAGVSLPLTPMVHQYAVSADLPELSGRIIPNLRDPDNLIYCRQREKCLIFGGYERIPATFSADAIPDRPDPTLQAFDAARFADLHGAAVQRIPALASVPIAQSVCGLESFTIDGGFLLGPATSLPNLWMACGFCAHGVSSAGGVGRALAEWIVHGDPGLDLAELTLKRFGGREFDTEEIRRGALRVYRSYYDLPAPG
jgi:glycine/D-amino acid oxidase-like deaminating enzyme